VISAKGVKFDSSAGAKSKVPYLYDHFEWSVV
jgi:hypothetical protein